MPTPYGSRGGMAFSANELRVLRRALAIALQSDTPTRRPAPERDADLRDCLRLVAAVDEAAREGGRLRAFLRADLARYRAALPGTAPGYLERLQDALTAGHRPDAEDLTALRGLCATPAGAAEVVRRRILLRRCESLAASAVDWGRAARPAAVPQARPAGAEASEQPVRQAGPARAESPEQPAPEPRPGPKPGARKPGTQQPEKPQPRPAAPRPARPDRPIPTPGEVFPPRRKPAPPPGARLTPA
ncbi:hypothetical protein [Streptomyces orinoci]|uniref:Uncharacterized protein n=1 Tax=Streptomyces orinoci TaxID=67339 RepID=A0ABV3JXE6_STRON|nr:hypothetical protein [Streptomyces orinoci]